MSAVFADSFYFLALVIDEDNAHEKVIRFSTESTRPIVTTEWVLTEVADALCEPENRPAFLELLALLESCPDVKIVASSHELFRRGVALYAERPDKEWSLTDCISFVVM